MFTSKNQDFRALIADKLDRQYFMRHMGFELTKIEAGRIEGRLPVGQIHKQQNEFIHGGVVSTICDIVAGFAAFSLVEASKHVVTAEIKVSYLRPGKGKMLEAEGWVVKPGNHFSFCEAEVWDIRDSGRVLIGKATTTMAIIDKFS